MSADAARPADLAEGSGLPGPLPEGETILWQGRPDPASVTRRILHLRWIAAYFGLIALYTAGSASAAGRSPAGIATSLAIVAAAALVVLGFAWLMGRLVARTTRYTITDRRIVMRIGVALPLTLNVPFKIVESAGLRVHRDGTGDLPVVIGGAGRIGYLHLWPHARPWHLRRPEPMLRCVPDAAKVAAILSRALGAGPYGSPAAIRQAVSQQTEAVGSHLPTPVAA